MTYFPLKCKILYPKFHPIRVPAHVQYHIVLAKSYQFKPIISKLSTSISGMNEAPGYKPLSTAPGPQMLFIFGPVKLKKQIYTLNICHI